MYTSTNTQIHNKVDKDDKHRRIKYRTHGAEWLTWYSTSNSLIVERDSVFANYLRPFFNGITIISNNILLVFEWEKNCALYASREQLHTK